jgi:anti-sigma factor RsiW
MNPDPTDNRLQELYWRRHRSPAEAAELAARLAARPDAAGRGQEEIALNHLLDHLPDAPVPGNFTARVMQDIERERAAAERQPARLRPWWQRPLLPRLAFAALLLGGGLFAYQRHLVTQQQRVAADLMAATEPGALLSVEVLQDFDLIARLGPQIQPDTELLSLLQ